MTTPLPLAHLPRGACVLVWDEQGRCLTVSRPTHAARCWPGGKQEPGETAIQAAHRELWEETGLRVARLDLLWAGVCGPNETGDFFWVEAFLGQDLEGEMVCREATVVPGWHTTDELLACAQFPVFVRQVLRAFDDLAPQEGRSDSSAGSRKSG